MRIADRNIFTIYGATLILGIAYGISIALTPHYLDANHFSKQSIGSLAAIFALGLVLLSLPMGALIRRFSARVTLIVSLVGYAISVSAFPFLHTYGAIAGARFFDGAFSVGIWVSSETILLSRSDRENKAFVTSFYAIAMALGYIIGPLGARALVALVREAPMTFAYLTAGALTILAAAAVVARLDPDLPTAREGEGGHLGHASTDASNRPRAAVSALTLFRRIKTCCFATFAYGYFQASVVLFLPLFLMESKHIPREQTILVTAFFAAGMLLSSNYAGRLGDKFGHLLVMRVLACVGLVMIAGFVYLDSFPIMACAVFVAGGSLASISPLSLALQGVITEPANYSRSNAIYNMFYAGGMLLGPPISSQIFGKLGGAGMLFHLAVLWGAFVIFSAVFYRDDPAVLAKRSDEAAGLVRN